MVSLVRGQTSTLLAVCFVHVLCEHRERRRTSAVPRIVLEPVKLMGV